MVRVVFVCLGNICRSPMAEAIFTKLVDQAGLSAQIIVDSAGTGSWHIGESAHSGTQSILKKHGIVYQGRARQIHTGDMANANSYIITMDQDNSNDLRRRFGSHPRLYRLLDFAEQKEVRDVPDPYYTGNFEYVYQLIVDGCHGLLAKIRAEKGI